MATIDVPGFGPYLPQLLEDLEVLRQNWLLSESGFISFARDCGVPVHGVVSGDPGEFFKHGLLTSDGLDVDRGPRFHPFRIYALKQTLEMMKLTGCLSLIRDVLGEDDERAIGQSTALEKSQEIARRSNNIVDLAVLLEPMYWPAIVGNVRLGASGIKREPVFETYRARMLQVVKNLDPIEWRDIHGSLRRTAAWMDQNRELYILLRLAPWEQRKDLKGQIAGALWIRHMAEIIRRCFEKVHSQEWDEEDRSFEHWPPGARKRIFGSERPLDHTLRSRPYLAYEFGLFTESVVRWYVEGETEYFAITEILGDPSVLGVEVLNLKGKIASERDNAALELEAWLKDDKKLRRSSLISFDSDVPENVRAVRRQVQQDNVVGSIRASKPDFEFENFDVSELAEIAARIDESCQFCADAVRKGDWSGVVNAKAFEKHYRVLSERRASGLKGEQWGRALGRYATEHPTRSDNGQERALLKDIRAAFHGRSSNYDLHQQSFTVDPVSFELVQRRLS